MELDAPIKISDQSYTIKIHTSEEIEVSYPSRETGSHTIPPDTLEPLQLFFQRLAVLYDAYSRRWFHVSVPAIGFLRRLSHIWQFDSHQPYSGPAPDSSQPAILVRQVWCPEQLHVLSRTIQVHWRLVRATYEVQHPSGFQRGGEAGLEGILQSDPSIIDAIPLEFGGGEAAANITLTSSRARALRKVREARMRAAAAKWRADLLVARYYERYGTTELMDGDSILSSDEEDGGVAATRPQTQSSK